MRRIELDKYEQSAIFENIGLYGSGRDIIKIKRLETLLISLVLAAIFVGGFLPLVFSQIRSSPAAYIQFPSATASESHPGMNSQLHQFPRSTLTAK